MLHWNRMTCGALCLRWKKLVGLFFEQKEITSGHCVFLGEKSLEWVRFVEICQRRAQLTFGFVRRAKKPENLDFFTMYWLVILRKTNTDPFGPPFNGEGLSLGCHRDCEQVKILKAWIVSFSLTLKRNSLHEHPDPVHFQRYSLYREAEKSCTHFFLLTMNWANEIWCSATS